MAFQPVNAPADSSDDTFAQSKIEKSNEGNATLWYEENVEKISVSSNSSSWTHNNATIGNENSKNIDPTGFI